MKSSKDKSSVERFNQTSAPNEIINFLKYFSQPSPVDGKVKMSWGAVLTFSALICAIVTNDFTSSSSTWKNWEYAWLFYLKV